MFRAAGLSWNRLKPWQIVPAGARPATAGMVHRYLIEPGACLKNSGYPPQSPFVVGLVAPAVFCN